MTKLRRLLANPVFDESWAVNVLVQIRKTIESDRKNDPHAWNIVNLFCAWALHTELTRDKITIGLFFKAFDFRDGMELEEFFASRYFRSFVALHGFRCELLFFLKQNGLATWLVEDTEDWLRFVYLYAGVVADAPITSSPNGILPEELQQLRLDRVSGRSGVEYIRTRAQLKNGREYSSMHLIPLRGDMPEPWFDYVRRRYPNLEG